MPFIQEGLGEQRDLLGRGVDIGNPTSAEVEERYIYDERKSDNREEDEVSRA